MHIENLQLFQNPAIYYPIKHGYGNGVILPANLFSYQFRTLKLRFQLCVCYPVTVIYFWEPYGSL